MKRLIAVILLVVLVVLSLATPPVHKPTKFILVDLQRQRLYAFQDEEKVFDFHCSTGRRGHRTPKGNFDVQEKLRWGQALEEYGSAKLPYCLRVTGHILIHGYSSVPNRPASHGCIRLAVSSAKKLYGWANVDTPVIICQHADDCLL